MPVYIVSYDPGESVNSFGHLMPNRTIAEYFISLLERGQSFIVPSNFGISVQNADGSWTVIAQKKDQF